jgi:integrase/recombinase XerD
MRTDTVSPLRQRMIEDMNARKLGSHTQRSHIYSCKRFAAFLKRSPDTATAEDIRWFQLHLSQTSVSICNRNRIMTGLRFLFRVTLRRLDLAAEIYHIREPQKIPLVMSPDETRRLLAVADNLKVRTLLGLGYGCGLRAGEVVTEGQAYRQCAEDHSGRAVQGPQGPQCYAVARDVRSAAPMVEGSPIA